MGKIVILDENTANKIAAGEVVERPASVVKEMVENSIDAGASSISVEIKNGGIKLIKIIDNGCGIAEDDAEIAFERHSTSKIRKAEDLEAIKTMGFRGEALSSIASVSKVDLLSRVQEKQYGVQIHIEAGKLHEIKQAGGPKGTTFTIQDLFFNTPARYKFLKKDSTEAAYVSDAVQKLALGNPEISFKFTSNGTSQLHTPGNGDLKTCIYSLFGREVSENLKELKYSDEKIKITGFIGTPVIARGNRNHQFIFMNKRYIKSKTIAAACEEAYKTHLMKGKYPFVVINLEILPQLVDVNVHPAKTEVRFWDEQAVFRSVYSAIKSSLSHEDDKPKFIFQHSNFSEKTVNTEASISQVKPIEFDVSKSFRKDSSINFNTSKDFNIEDSAKLKEFNNTESVKTSTEFIEENIIENLNTTNNEKEGCNNFSEIKTNFEESNKINAPSINKNYSNNSNIVSNQIIADNSDKKIDSVFEYENEFSAVKDNILHVEKTKPVHEQQSIVSESTTNEYGIADYHIIGQAFNTYILVQQGDKLLFIDQHAAHERLVYDKLVKSFLEGKIHIQMLAIPLTITLTPKEMNTFKDNLDFFRELGFEGEEFGHNSVIIRGIPNVLEEEKSKDVFTEILDKLTVHGKISTKESIKANEILYDIACKSAIKGGKRLDNREIEVLLMDLAGKNGLLTCPHGRPVITEVTKKELEKKFKRIV